MNQTPPCGGCSGGCHGSCGGCAPLTPEYHLTRDGLSLLSRLSSILYLPMAQFVLVPRGQDVEDGTLVLSPVLLEDPGDSLEQVADRGDLLVDLALQGLITLDFDLPVSNFSYAQYYGSDLFREFSRNFAQDARGRPTLRRGSLAITENALRFLENNA